MSGDDTEPRVLFSVLLGDANVLYPRVLRDYLLYAMSHQIIRVMWSAGILDEAVEHLIENIGGFDRASGERLAAAMNGAFPYSQVEPTEDAAAAVAGFVLPDEDDRHVIVAAVAAEATFLCTDDLKGFPDDVMAALGIEAVTSDALAASSSTRPATPCSRSTGPLWHACQEQRTNRRSPPCAQPGRSAPPT